MDYINNVNKLIRNYMLTFILNTIVFVFTLSLGIETKWLIILSVLTSIVSLIAYSILKKANKLKNLAFHILTIAISFLIAAVYSHFSYNVDFFNTDTKAISIPSLVALTIVVEGLYLVMKLLINRFSLCKMAIFISLVFSGTLILSVYYIGKNYNDSIFTIFYCTVFYSIIFFSSVISILFLKETEKFQTVLMVSHFFIFLIVFIIAVSIIAEDGSFLEFFTPDISNNKNKKSN
jgi:hypothetical protein